MEIRDRVPFFRRPALLVITLPFLILPFGSSLAEGLAVSAQSASAAAVAVAGVAAGVDDAATVFYNPAGMTRLTINEVTAAIGIVRSSLRPSQTRGLDVLGGPMQGTTGAQNVTNIVPSIYAVFVPAKNLRLGVGVSTPFGQRLAYDSRWLGRYEVQDAQLQDNSLSLAAAYQVSEFVSFGGSVDYHQAKVKRISAVDFGATCAGILGLGPCGFLGLLPQQTDGKARLEVSGNGLGYKLGVTADYRNGWRTGLVYRSPVKLNLGGDLRFEVPVTAGVLNATGAFDPTNAYSHFTLPESLHWGLSWDVEDRTRILLGVNWSRWNRLSALQVTFDNPDHVVIEFRDARVVDHSAIEAIDALASRYQQMGKTLHLRHLSPDCLELLDRAKGMVEVSEFEDPHYHIADNKLG